VLLSTKTVVVPAAAAERREIGLRLLKNLEHLVAIRNNQKAGGLPMSTNAHEIIPI
jgi:hypothetical protein